MAHPTSSSDDFITSNTTMLGPKSPSRRPATKKKKSSIGGASGIPSGGKEDVNPDGSPRRRKNPPRSARPPPQGERQAVLPPLSTNENLAEVEKPPEMTEAERKAKRQQERIVEKRKTEERAARKELRKLAKAEAAKQKELDLLEEAAAAAEVKEAMVDQEAEAAAAAERDEKRKARAAEKAEKVARKTARKEAKAEKVRLATIAKEAEEEQQARMEGMDEASNQSSHSDSENDDMPNSDDEDDPGEDDDDGDNHRSYSEAAAAGQGNDDDTASVHNVRWIARRVRVNLKIEIPPDKEARLVNLQDKINQILKLGRKTEPNLFLRNFERTGVPTDDEKHEWVREFSSKELSANHFCEYMSQGLNSWIPLDRNTFYFRTTLVFPATCRVEKVLDEISHFIPDSCKISDLLSQEIFDPVKIGSLLRSNEKMTSTEGFLLELNRRARQMNPDVRFGMSYSEMRRPNGERAKDWKKATRAVQLETNAHCMREATDIALRLFPGKRTKGHKPVWGMNLVFVYDIGHEDVDNLDTAQQNIDVLVGRQKMHMKYETRCSTNKIFPGALDDRVYSGDDTDTLRDILMEIKSTTTSGCEGGNLFSSVMYSDYKKKKEYWFSYHRKVKKEAEAIVRALPVMLKQEYGLTIERLFYESAIDPSDQWNPVTRSLRNAITRATDNMLDGTEDLICDDQDEEDEDVVLESENISLNTAESKERQRMMGDNDEETVINQKQRRKQQTVSTRKNVQPINVSEIHQAQDDGSVSTLGDGTADFSSASKKKRFQREVLVETSELVKESAKKANRQAALMQQSLEDERRRSDALEKQLATMQQWMAAAGFQGDNKTVTSGNSRDGNGSTGQQSNGQGSQEDDAEPVIVGARATSNTTYATPTRGGRGRHGGRGGRGGRGNSNRFAVLQDNADESSASNHSDSAHEEDGDGKDDEAPIVSHESDPAKGSSNGDSNSAHSSDHANASGGDSSSEQSNASNTSGSYTYYTHEDGTITAQEIIREPQDEDDFRSDDDNIRFEEDMTSQQSQASNLSGIASEDEDEAANDGNSITASVQSALALGRKRISELAHQATGGVPGGED